jgi:hypothetical protein
MGIQPVRRKQRAVLCATTDSRIFTYWKRRMRKLIVSIAILLGCAATAHAEFGIPDYELVHTAPLETTLTTPDLREPLQVWSEMFDAARHEIDLGQFYVAGKPGAAFDQVIGRLAAAGQRGVKIRFLMEEKGKFASDMPTTASSHLPA